MFDNFQIYVLYHETDKNIAVFAYVCMGFVKGNLLLSHCHG